MMLWIFVVAQNFLAQQRRDMSIAQLNSARWAFQRMDDTDIFNETYVILDDTWKSKIEVFRVNVSDPKKDVLLATISAISVSKKPADRIKLSKAVKSTKKSSNFQVALKVYEFFHKEHPEIPRYAVGTGRRSATKWDVLVFPQPGPPEGEYTFSVTRIGRDQYTLKRTSMRRP